MLIDLKAKIYYDPIAQIYVSYTPVFDLFSQGENEERALIALKDAVKSGLQVAVEKNLLEKCIV